MKGTDDRLRQAATDHGAATIAIIDSLRAARGGAWELPPGASTKQAIGDIGDPTGTIASEPTGLLLRARVEDALARLTAATGAFRRAATELDEALERHSSPHGRHTAAREGYAAQNPAEGIVEPLLAT